MKKKVWINGKFLTQPLTGVQRSAYELVKALDAAIEANPKQYDDYEIQLIYSGKILNLLDTNHIKITKKGIFSGNIWEQFELPVYTAGHLLVSLCTVSTLFKRKQIVMVHDASFLVNPNFFPLIFRTWYSIAIPTIGKLARHIITVSNFSKKELIRHAKIKEKKIGVIYNAADHMLTYDDPDALFKQRINQLKPYCLAVSSLSLNKNFHGLSLAINHVQSSNYNFLIAGGQSKTLRDTSPLKGVTYLGYVTNDELKYLYSNASLFIFPSFYEGFGIPPLEAMILGCPVLASQTSSLPEVLADACEYCDPTDFKNIANRIQHLIARPQRLKELREKGYARSQLFSWNKSALQLYESMKRFA